MYKFRFVSIALSILAIIGVLGLLGAKSQGIPQEDKTGNPKLLFETRYQTWINWRKNPPAGSLFKSDHYQMYCDNQPFREIVELGPPAVPYIIEKLEEDRLLVYALREISKWRYHTHRFGEKPGEYIWTVEEFPDIRGSHPSPQYLWLRWWKEGKKLTAQQFEKFYQKWKKLKQEGKETEAKAKYQRMIDSGVAALPYMLEKVKQGDVELVPAISVLTDNKVKKDAKQSECLDWWEKNKQKWLIPFPDIKADNTPTHKDQPGAEEPNEG